MVLHMSEVELVPEIQISPVIEKDDKEKNNCFMKGFSYNLSFVPMLEFRLNEEPRRLETCSLLTNI